MIVPTGATEQHGPHAPLATDVLIPQEIARRIAPTIGAVVAPPLSYALSYPHVGFKGLVHIRIPTFMSLVEDVAVAFATRGFRRIIFLNGHYDNTYAIAYACANASERLPRDAKAFPLNYWDGFPAEVARGKSAWPRACTPMPQRRARSWRSIPDWWIWTRPTLSSAVPGLQGQHRTRAHRLLLHVAWLQCWATKSGTWGDATQATKELGERYLQAGVDATIAVLADLEKTFAAMPPR